MADSPNAIAVAGSVAMSLLRVDAPDPHGSSRITHQRLEQPLRHLAVHGVSSLPDLVGDLNLYLQELEAVEPNQLDPQEALAFWVNVYNAGALVLAADAQRSGELSVLRVPGGFRRRFITIAGERLSLDNIEHGKVRRFHDPRVHAALVCGSISCPALRGEPYVGASLSDSLDDQLVGLLAVGGAIADYGAGVINLSRIFLWFGADFVRPSRMPTILPARPRAVAASLRPWLEPDVAAWVRSTRPRVRFQPYDWGLACQIR